MNNFSGYGCSRHGHRNHGEVSHHHQGGCCGHGHSMRRFFTKEEMLNQLEEYLKQLKAESKGVEERIAELKKAG